MVSKLVNCKKCNIKCPPIYELKPFYSHLSQFICRECTLEITKEYYDRRPDETEKTD